MEPRALFFNTQKFSRNYLVDRNKMYTFVTKTYPTGLGNTFYHAYVTLYH